MADILQFPGSRGQDKKTQETSHSITLVLDYSEGRLLRMSSPDCVPGPETNDLLRGLLMSAVAAVMEADLPGHSVLLVGAITDQGGICIRQWNDPETPEQRSWLAARIRDMASLALKPSSSND